MNGKQHNSTILHFAGDSNVQTVVIKIYQLESVLLCLPQRSAKSYLFQLVRNNYVLEALHSPIPVVDERGVNTYPLIMKFTDTCA